MNIHPFLHKQLKIYRDVGKGLLCRGFWVRAAQASCGSERLLLGHGLSGKKWAQQGVLHNYPALLVAVQQQSWAGHGARGRDKLSRCEGIIPSPSLRAGRFVSQVNSQVNQLARLG